MHYFKLRKLFLFAMLLCVGLVPLSAQAHSPFPDILDLPLGWQPEGIATGPGASLYVGSIPTGAIYKFNALNGSGDVLVAGQEGRNAIGIKYDWRTQYLYVAGGPSGKIFVYNALTGEDVAVVQATEETSTFINDAVITCNAVYFTDSFREVLYRLALRPGGRLPAEPQLTEIPLSGDFEFIEGTFNANGIVAAPGHNRLIIVHSTLGTLYSVDATTGETSLIDLGDDDLVNGDGLLLVGRTLYAVQNANNQIAVVTLSHDLSSGSVRKLITNDNLDVPSTISRLGSALYAVNARFTTPPTPETQYSVVRVR